MAEEAQPERRPSDPFFYPTTIKPLTGLGLSMITQTVPQTKRAEVAESPEPAWEVLPSLEPTRAPLYVPAPLSAFTSEAEEHRSLQQQNNMLGRQIQELEHAKSLAAAQSAQALQKIRSRQEQLKKESALALQQTRELQREAELQQRAREAALQHERAAPRRDRDLGRLPSSRGAREGGMASARQSLESAPEEAPANNWRSSSPLTARGREVAVEEVSATTPRLAAAASIALAEPPSSNFPLDGGVHRDSESQSPTRRKLDERGSGEFSASQSQAATPLNTVARSHETRSSLLSQNLQTAASLLPDGQPYVDALGNPLGFVKGLDLPNIKDEPPEGFASPLLSSGDFQSRYPFLSYQGTGASRESLGNQDIKSAAFAANDLAPVKEAPLPSGVCTRPAWLADVNSVLPSTSVFSTAAVPAEIDNTDGIVAEREPPAMDTPPMDTGGLVAKSSESLRETQVVSPVTTPKGDGSGSPLGRPKEEPAKSNSPGPAEREKVSTAGAMERRSSSTRRRSNERSSERSSERSNERSSERANERSNEDDRRASLEPPITEQMQAELDECLDTIKWCAASVTRESLQDLKNLNKPEAAVKEVLETVALLLGIVDTKWDKLKKSIVAMDFPQRLQKLNFQQSVSREQFKKLRERLAHPEFDEEYLKSVSVAVVPLATWCRAIGVHLSRTKYRGGPTIRPLLSAGGVSTMSTTSASNSGSGTPVADLILIKPDLSELSPEELMHVPDLTISRPGIGQITFPGETDCTGLDFQRIVRLEVGEVLVYPDAKMKPEIGQGLNKPATVLMFQCYPPAGSKMMTDPAAQERYKKKIRAMTEEKHAHFIDYDCLTGVWTFSVDHF